MPYYRRADQPGGTFFFTLVTHRRNRILCEPLARNALHAALETARQCRPFEIEACVLLPDHFHPLITLPCGDADFSLRIASVKASFTSTWLAAGGKETAQSASRARRGYRGVWQKRFWEHHVRDDDDFANHLDYIHYNPVKHGLVTCPHLWPWSTFRKWVARGIYPSDWLCVCGGRNVEPPVFGGFDDYEME
jgi:putative transposase